MEITNEEANFQLGLLYFFHLLDDEGGLTEETGHEFVYDILDEENLSKEIFHQFILEIWGKTHEQIYRAGLEYIHQCSFENRLRLFSRLYQVANVIGHGALKEVRLMLYSTNQNDIDTVAIEMRANDKSFKQTA